MRRRAMIKGALIVFALFLVSCSTADERQQNALMDEIEHTLRLPPGAGPLRSYARYYTELDGKVIGAYTRDVEGPRPPDYGCENLQLNGGSEPVACPAVADLPLGQRRWVKFADYPAVAGEDCTAIQLEFDPRKRKITYLECVRPIY